jgi:hypothetical protein
MATYNQPNFRGRRDTETINSSTFDWSLNTNFTVDIGEIFRVRFEAEETAGTGGANTFKLQYNHDAAGWVDVDPWDAAPNGSPVLAVESSQYTDGDATTNVISGSSEAFTAGTGESGDASFSSSISSQHTEVEFCLIIRRLYTLSGAPAQVDDSDTFELRIVENDGTPFNSYTSPTVTANLGTNGAINGVFIETPGRVFHEDGGDLYFLCEDSESSAEWCVMKSTDGGDSWSLTDNANRPTAATDLETSDSVFAGNTIYISQHTGDDIYFHTFRTSGHASADTWGTTDKVIKTGVALNVNQQSTAIERRSDGDLVVFYNDANGGDDAGYYQISTDSGSTWDGEVTLDATAGISVHDIRVVRGASDLIHIFYNDRLGGVAYHRSLSSADSLSGRETAEADTGTGTSERAPIVGVVYWDSSGDEKIMAAIKDGSDNLVYSVVVTNDGSPESRKQASDNTVDFDPSPGSGSRQCVADLQQDGSDTWLWYADGTDFDLYRDSATNDGGWGTDTEELDGTTTIYIRGLIFTHSAANGSDKVYGRVRDRFGGNWPGGLYYDEYVIASGVSPVSVSITPDDVDDFSQGVKIWG